MIKKKKKKVFLLSPPKKTITVEKCGGGRITSVRCAHPICKLFLMCARTFLCVNRRDSCSPMPERGYLLDYTSTTLLLSSSLFLSVTSFRSGVISLPALCILPAITSPIKEGESRVHYSLASGATL